MHKTKQATSATFREKGRKENCESDMMILISPLGQRELLLLILRILAIGFRNLVAAALPFYKLLTDDTVLLQLFYN
jgi:hypothetical protein